MLATFSRQGQVEVAEQPFGFGSGQIDFAKPAFFAIRSRRGQIDFAKRRISDDGEIRVTGL